MLFCEKNMSSTSIRKTSQLPHTNKIMQALLLLLLRSCASYRIFSQTHHSSAPLCAAVQRNLSAQSADVVLLHVLEQQL